MHDLFRPWGSITASGRGAGPPKAAYRKLSPAVVPKKCAPCVWMITNAIGVAGCMVEGSACRDGRHDNEVRWLPHNPLLLRTGRQRRANSSVVMTRRRTER